MSLIIETLLFILRVIEDHTKLSFAEEMELERLREGLYKTERKNNED